MDTLGKVVSASAPMLGSVLNAFLPGSGLIISGLNAIFGSDPNQPDDLLAKIAQDSESALKLKQFEMEHQSDLAKIIAADRASARDRQVEYAKSMGRDWVMDFLAVFVSVSFVTLCFIIAFADITATEKDLFYMLIGTFGAVWANICSFYFGGSTSTSYQKQNKDQEVILPPPAKTR